MLGATAAVLLLVPLLMGCAGNANTESSAGTAAKQAAPPPGSVEKPGAAEQPGSAAGQRQDAGQGGATAQSQPIRLAPIPTRAVIYTANLRVRARNVEGAASRAKQLVTAVGGYVETETATTGESATATVTFKIPAERYAATLDQLSSQLGTRVALQQQAQDVTQEVADVDSRVKSAQAALVSFRKLLDRANTVGEVLNVEQELASREADLESLQARQKSLAQQTSFGTVTLQLEAPGVAAAKRHGGFMGGLRAGWAAFGNFLAGLALVLGWLLPFLVLVAFIGLPAWWLRHPVRRYVDRRRATSGQPAMPE